MSLTIHFDNEKIKREILKQAAEKWTRKISHIKCPVHGQVATVTVDWSSSDPHLVVQGCCEKLVNMIDLQKMISED